MDAQTIRWVLAAHAGATLMMVGLIWTIQLVHYPLFDSVGAEGFARYHAGHTARISLLVMPLMLAEVMTAVLLLGLQPPQIPTWSLWAGAGLLAVIWGSTFFLQVPQHGALSGGFVPEVHRAMVQSNWIRTLAWSARGALVMMWFGSR